MKWKYRFPLENQVPLSGGQSVTFEDGSWPPEVFAVMRDRNMEICSLYTCHLRSSTLACASSMAVCGRLPWDPDTTASPHVTVPHRKVIFFRLGNSMWHCQHSCALGWPSKKQRTRGLLLWCTSVNGRWFLASVELACLGLQGFLWLPPFFPWASFVGSTSALLQGALRLDVLRMKSKWSLIIPVFSSTHKLFAEFITSTSYMITVHGAFVHPFLILSSN